MALDEVLFKQQEPHGVPFSWQHIPLLFIQPKQVMERVLPYSKHGSIPFIFCALVIVVLLQSYLITNAEPDDFESITPQDAKLEYTLYLGIAFFSALSPWINGLLAHITGRVLEGPGGIKKLSIGFYYASIVELILILVGIGLAIIADDFSVLYGEPNLVDGNLSRTCATIISILDYVSTAYIFTLGVVVIMVVQGFGVGKSILNLILSYAPLIAIGFGVAWFAGDLASFF